MADAIIDFAALEAPVVETTPVADTTTTTDTPVTADSNTETTTGTDGKETETLNADGTDKTPEQVEEFKAKAAAAAAKDELPGTEKTPQEVRKALKALRDADPKNAAYVKTLHGSYERHQAYKAEFETVDKAREAKAFIESIGGEEGYKELNTHIDAVKAADELLYNSDPQIWDNVIEDLKASGHPEAFGKLAPAYLEKLKAHDSEAFYKTFTPHFVEGLKEVGFERTLGQMMEALDAKNEKGESVPNVERVKQAAKIMSDWYKGQVADVEAAKKVPEQTPEMKKFLAEKAEFEKTKTADQQAKVKTWESNVATTADSYSNTALKGALTPVLKMPFFKDFPRETLIDLGNGIKERLYATLKADKTYQSTMAAYWKGGDNPANNTKIQAFHKQTLDRIANDVVTKVVQNRYPGYAKGGSAAGRVAAAQVKKDNTGKAEAAATSSGKPIYVATRPTNLIRESIKVGSREYSTGDLQTLQILGRGFVKSTDGKSYRLVTWRK